MCLNENKKMYSSKIIITAFCAFIGASLPAVVLAQSVDAQFSEAEFLKTQLAQAQEMLSPQGQAGADVGSSPRLPDSALPQTASTVRDGGMDLSAMAAPAAPSSIDPFAEEVSAAPREKTKEEVDAEIRSSSYTAAATGLMPLEAGEIRSLLQRFDETQQAAEIPLYPYPTPEISVHTVSLDPGVIPSTIKLGVGHVTTLNMMDATGQPWPIKDLSWAGNFEIVQPEEGSHVVRITPMSEFAYGNISVRMLDMPTPITFTLKTHRDVVQYRFDARIPEFGPMATAPLIEGGLTLVAGDVTLSNVLEGVPPEGANKLAVAGVDGRTSAYVIDGKTYLRTPLTLLSPGWSQSVTSADGMKVYVVANAPVVMLSDRGQVVRARLSKKEALK